jgi:NAD(P)H-hydrate repair Nnr-like enzyme with NAD(P)H-hydrate epimerase domain
VKIVTTREMIDLERRCDAMGTPPSELMEHAGLAIARHIHSRVGNVAGRDIVIFAGPGNNGGDGLVTARHLRDWEPGSVSTCPYPGKTIRTCVW